MIRTLHQDSVDPVTTDGRDIDTSIAELSGEAGQQISGRVEQHLANPWHELPEPSRGDPTYYDRPVLRKPVWKPYIPLYYYVGGAAGASLALGAAAQFDGSRKLDRLVRRCHWTGIIGSSIGGALLVADLGRPERFIMMLRVFRPTSPMNMGAWILAVAPSAAIVAGLFARRGPFELLGEIAGYSSGAFGAALATYTGVLVSNSAIPLWQQGRQVMPLLFGASAVASAASLLDILFDDPHATRINFSFGLAGRLAELTAAHYLERQAAAVTPRVADPLRHGWTGVAWRAASILTAASLVVSILPNRSRKTRIAAGVLGTAGSLVLRFAVHYAGVKSSQDPRATFHVQRAGG